MSDRPAADLLALTANIVSAHVGHKPVSAATLPSLIETVYHSLAAAGSHPVETEKKEPAVSIKKSVFPDRIIRLDCGKHFKMLKRHLESDHNITPALYRERWGLPLTYPLVAPDYAEKRSEMAKTIPAYQPIDPNQVADSGGPDGGNGRATAIRPVMRR